MERKDFIEFVANEAANDWDNYQILPSITIAQAILESDWGTSELAKKANNLFGIKGNHEGYAYAKGSWEYVDGKDITEESYFRHYPTKEESIADHGEFFSSTPWRKKYYSGIIGEADYKKAANELAGKYATDPNYGSKLISLIDEHKLTQYDPANPTEQEQKKPKQENESAKEPEGESGMAKKNEKTLLIDAGHGGSDPGANGFGVQEKDWTLEISLYQYKRLKELGANVSISRTTDKSLSSTARTSMIRNKYDICVSNHWNAFNGAARGVETIHSIFANPKLATDLANAVVSATGLPLRRVFSKKNSSGTDWYYMHRLTGNTRTVIIEYGFIDNKLDHAAYKKQSVFYAAAEAVIRVLCAELGIAYRAPGSAVSKPKATGPVLPGTLFKVQAGSFEDKEGAEKRQGLLEGKGIDSFILKVDGQYKVQAGAYAEKENANDRLVAVKKYVPDAFIKQEGADPVRTAPAAIDYEPGDRVLLKEGAGKYTTGEKIPDWVDGKVYTVQQEGKGKVLLKEILSWVYESDIQPA